jgi:3-phosphoshikimate 1-carboxyvinyltransferase
VTHTRSFVALQKNNIVRGTVRHLPSSKSISNRALIINALCGNQSVVSNLSAARDTVLMKSQVQNPELHIDVQDAGTTMRFLAAYFAVTGQHKILTGTERMKQRPIAPLVNALRHLGANVQYLGQEGFPPIEIKGFGTQKTDVVSVPGNISSQYISALMMIAPKLPKGLTIQVEGIMGSRPYLEMTASLMGSFGASCDFKENSIHIATGGYQPAALTVEADWSAASYWFAFASLAGEAEITLPDISGKSLQGDRVIDSIMDHLGVKTGYVSGSLVLTKKDHDALLEWDFSNCPDLAQTVIPVCAAKGVRGKFTGMESLRIKETDRITALQQEISKLGAKLDEAKGVWILAPGRVAGPLTFDTYHDHRMAMGLAPLASLTDLRIEDPQVVNKSYPEFWVDLQEMGFEVNFG